MSPERKMFPGRAEGQGQSMCGLWSRNPCIRRSHSRSRCGFSVDARSSFGAHSNFSMWPDGNLLIDSPRYAAELVKWFDASGGIGHILLSHRDDVADADKYARQFGARVWINGEGRSAAPCATDLLDDGF